MTYEDPAITRERDMLSHFIGGFALAMIGLWIGGAAILLSVEYIGSHKSDAPATVATTGAGTSGTAAGSS